MKKKRNRNVGNFRDGMTAAQYRNFLNGQKPDVRISDIITSKNGVKKVKKKEPYNVVKTSSTIGFLMDVKFIGLVVRDQMNKMLLTFKYNNFPSDYFFYNLHDILRVPVPYYGMKMTSSPDEFLRKLYDWYNKTQIDKGMDTIPFYDEFLVRINEASIN